MCLPNVAGPRISTSAPHSRKASCQLTSIFRRSMLKSVQFLKWTNTGKSCVYCCTVVSVIRSPSFLACLFRRFVALGMNSSKYSMRLGCSLSPTFVRFTSRAPATKAARVSVNSSAFMSRPSSALICKARWFKTCSSLLKSRCALSCSAGLQPGQLFFNFLFSISQAWSGIVIPVLFVTLLPLKWATTTSAVLLRILCFKYFGLTVYCIVLFVQITEWLRQVGCDMGCFNFMKSPVYIGFIVLRCELTQGLGVFVSQYCQHIQRFSCRFRPDRQQISRSPVGQWLTGLFDSMGGKMGGKLFRWHHAHLRYPKGRWIYNGWVLGERVHALPFIAVTNNPMRDRFGNVAGLSQMAGEHDLSLSSCSMIPWWYDG